MSEVGIVDTTLRDGNQSLWSARGVTTDLVRDVAPIIDRAGFEVCEFITSTIMAMAIKHQREDPWERIRLAKSLMPDTPLGFLTTGKRFITWQRTPDTLLELAYELLARNGISRFWVCDPMVEASGARENAAMAKRAGVEEVVCGLVYSISPIHTDEFYARAAAELDDCPDIDAVYLKDPGGLLTPERLTTLVPAIRSGLRRTPLKEVHSHCNTGLAPRMVLDAVDMGIGTVHCAVGPAANGTAQPPVRGFVENLRVRGHTAGIDLDAIAELERRLEAHVAAYDLPVGRPLEYGERYFVHQMPGGMVSTLVHQLREINRVDLLPAIQEEVGQVRRDFGYPIMVTPFSQFMAAQAGLNVMSGERYGKLTDDTILYVLGDYGRPPGPIDPELRDRAVEEARQRSLSIEREQPTLADLRRRYGAHPDEDLLMSALISPDEVAASHAGGPRRVPRGATHDPLRVLLEGLRDREDVRSFSFADGDLRLELRR